MVENTKRSAGKAGKAQLGVLLALVAASATGGCYTDAHLPGLPNLDLATGKVAESIANKTDAPEPQPQIWQ